MKKIILSALALFAAVSLALAGGPMPRFGSLSSDGQMTVEQLKSVKSLQLDGAESGQELVSFTVQIWNNGKLVSHSPVIGSEMSEEFRIMLSRAKPGYQIMVKEVKVKNASGRAETLAGTMKIDII